jgi:hypothetical protein
MDLEYTADRGVSVITLNRPQVGNAFTFDMLDAWAGALRNAARDPDVRAIVLTGAGGAFCSGVDLAEIKKIEDTPIAHKRMMTKMVYQVAEAAEDLDKPLIAAVNGSAVGAGMDMALMCDMRFVSRKARFSEGYIRVGLVPGDGGCYYLPRIVGEAKALELLLTGDFRRRRGGSSDRAGRPAVRAGRVAQRDPGVRATPRRTRPDQRGVHQVGGAAVEEDGRPGQPGPHLLPFGDRDGDRRSQGGHAGVQ